HSVRSTPTVMTNERLSDLGVWSVTLSVAFTILFTLWAIYIRATPMPRPTFFSDPLHATLLLGAAATAIGGGVTGVLAVVRNHERSIATFLSVLIGAVVLYWTLGELLAH